MSSLNYPLKQLADIKKKRQEEAEKVLRNKKDILAKEEALLKELEKKRDAVQLHHDDKLRQLRDTLDQGSSSDKITQMKQYLKIVKENLILEDKKVAAQATVVEKASHAVDIAKQDLFKKQKDVEKLKLHEAEWEKMSLHEQKRIEELEEDEMGSISHYLKNNFEK